MISWQPKKWIRFLTITFASLVLILTVSLSVCLISLSQGPINLQFLKSHLSAQVHTNHHQHGFNFDSLVLRWDKFDEPIVIEGKNITVVSSRSPIRSLQIPHLILKFHLRQILLWQMIPRDIHVSSPQLEYDLYKTHPTSSSNSLQSYLNKAPAFLANLMSFKRLVISDAKIKIFSTKESAPILVEGNVNLIRKRGTFHGDVYAKSSENNLLQGSARFDPQSFKTFLSINAVNLNPSLIFALAPSLMSRNLSFKQLSFHLKLLHTVQRGFEAGKGTFLMDGLHIAKNNSFEQDLDIKSVRLRGSFVDQEVALNELNLSYKGANLTSHGLGRYHKHSIKFDTQTTVTGLPLNDLSHVWPSKSAEDAREWITKNIRDGEIPNANVIFNGTYDLKHAALRLDQVSGQIEIQNARLSYIDSMPKIEKLNATANFNQDQSDIKIHNGTCNRLNILGGSVILRKLSDPVPLVTLNIETKGSISDVLNLIDYKPLQYASKFNISAAKAAGTVLAQLNMRFPLEKKIDANKIETKVEAKATNARMKEVLGLPIELQEGTCEVTISDKKLSVSGKGLLNGSPSDFVVEKFFPSANSKIKETCLVKMNLNPNSLARFGFPLETIVQGIIPTELQFNNSSANGGTLNIKADLTKALIRVFNIVKPAHKNGTLLIQAKLKNNTITEISKFEIKAAPDIYVSGNAIFSKGFNKLKSIKLNHLKVGDSNLIATMICNQQGEYELDVHAQSLDLSQYVQSHTNQDLWDFNNEKPIYVKLHADRLQLGGSKDLIRNDLQLMLDHGKVRSLSFSGNMENVKDNKEQVEIAIEPLSNNTRRFTLKTDKAGSLFKCLGILENVRKGALRIVALHDDSSAKSSWDGKLTMESFNLINAPFLSHFVSLAFPTGLADLTQGEGLSFMYLKAKFSARPDKIFIPSGRANGFSMGFSFNGNIERGQRGLVNLSGSIIPAYFLNTLISKIPLIGELVSGGKHEGLFGVSFNITGPKNDPQISVNPLSALTPGLLRKIFMPFDGSDNSMDDDLDVVSDDDKDLQYVYHSEE